MSRAYLSLKPSEQIVAASACNIYAAYVSAGRVQEGDEEQWMERAVKESLRIAQITDDRVSSDDEMS